MPDLTGFQRETFLGYCGEYVLYGREGDRRRVEESLVSVYGKDVASLVLDVLDSINNANELREDDIAGREEVWGRDRAELSRKQALYYQKLQNLKIIIAEIQGID